jgi:hypothetical protein
MADERIPKKMLEMKLRGRRPRGRPKARWMDQVKREMEKRGKKWTQVQQDRDRCNFFVTVDTKNWKQLKKDEEEDVYRLPDKQSSTVIQINLMIFSIILKAIWYTVE